MKKIFTLEQCKEIRTYYPENKRHRLKPLLGQPNFETHWSKIKREENI